jgi:hypothetical protein
MDLDSQEKETSIQMNGQTNRNLAEHHRLEFVQLSVVRKEKVNGSSVWGDKEQHQETRRHVLAKEEEQELEEREELEEQEELDEQQEKDAQEEQEGVQKQGHHGQQEQHKQQKQHKQQEQHKQQNQHKLQKQHTQQQQQQHQQQQQQEEEKEKEEDDHEDQEREQEDSARAKADKSNNQELFEEGRPQEGGHPHQQPRTRATDLPLPTPAEVIARSGGRALAVIRTMQVKKDGKT